MPEYLYYAIVSSKDTITPAHRFLLSTPHESAIPEWASYMKEHNYGIEKITETHYTYDECYAVFTRNMSYCEDRHDFLRWRFRGGRAFDNADFEEMHRLRKAIKPIRDLEVKIYFDDLSERGCESLVCHSKQLHVLDEATDTNATHDPKLDIPRFKVTAPNAKVLDAWYVTLKEAGAAIRKLTDSTFLFDECKLDIAQAYDTYPDVERFTGVVEIIPL